MSNINKLLSNPNLLFASQNELVNLINELMIQNRELYDRLPFDVQNHLGANLYGIQLIKNYNQSDLFGNTIFNKQQIVNDLGELLITVKVLLKTKNAIQEKIKAVEEAKAEKERRDLEIIRAAITKPVVSGPVFIELKNSYAEYQAHRDLLIGKELKDLYVELNEALEYIFNNRDLIKGPGNTSFISKSKEEISLKEIDQYIKNNLINKVYTILPSGLELWEAKDFLLNHARILYFYLSHTIYASGSNLQFNEIFSKARSRWNVNSKQLKDSIGIFKIFENLNSLAGPDTLDITVSTIPIQIPPTHSGTTTLPPLIDYNNKLKILLGSGKKLKEIKSMIDDELDNIIKNISHYKDDAGNPTTITDRKQITFQNLLDFHTGNNANSDLTILPSGKTIKDTIASFLIYLFELCNTILTSIFKTGTDAQFQILFSNPTPRPDLSSTTPKFNVPIDDLLGPAGINLSTLNLPILTKKKSPIYTIKEFDELYPSKQVYLDQTAELKKPGKTMADLDVELKKAIDKIWDNRDFINGSGGVPFYEVSKEDINLKNIQEYIGFDLSEYWLESGVKLNDAKNYLLDYTKKLTSYLVATLFDIGSLAEYQIFVNDPNPLDKYDDSIKLLRKTDGILNLYNNLLTTGFNPATTPITTSKPVDKSLLIVPLHPNKKAFYVALQTLIGNAAPKISDGYSELDRAINNIFSNKNLFDKSSGIDLSTIPASNGITWNQIKKLQEYYIAQSKLAGFNSNEKAKLHLLDYTYRLIWLILKSYANKNDQTILNNLSNQKTQDMSAILKGFESKKVLDTLTLVGANRSTYTLFKTAGATNFIDKFDTDIMAGGSINNIYKAKYLKYKTKYLELKAKIRS
jgi:hypothetical protein